ncbi:hypothetical protein [Streptomyces lonarensis]|nr:hypothetical protein [Streptomyces lonarensis]
MGHMGEFFTAALTYPAVIFTFPLLVVVAYWLIAAVTGLAGDLLDGGDTAEGGSADTGGFTGALSALGLGGVPVTVVLSLVVAVSWFTALVGTVLLDGVLLRTVALAVALYTGWQATWLLARPLRRALRTTSASRNADLVGQVCEVRVGCAPGRFGQGLVALPDGGTALIDIRSEEPEPVPAGSHALIYDYDAAEDFYRVAPAGAAADPLG